MERVKQLLDSMQNQIEHIRKQQLEAEGSELAYLRGQETSLMYSYQLVNGLSTLEIEIEHEVTRKILLAL